MYWFSFWSLIATQILGILFLIVICSIYVSIKDEDFNFAITEPLEDGARLTVNQKFTVDQSGRRQLETREIRYTRTDRREEEETDIDTSN